MLRSLYRIYARETTATALCDSLLVNIRRPDQRDCQQRAGDGEGKEHFPVPYDAARQQAGGFHHMVQRVQMRQHLQPSRPERDRNDDRPPPRCARDP